MLVMEKRLVWIDILNIVACAGVLLLHCTNSQVHGFSGTPSLNWYIGLTTHSFFLWPVDVFFMISGFTLIRTSILINNNNSEGIKQFYGRRLKRLAIPLISWNILYMIHYLMYSYRHGMEVLPIIELIRKFIFFDYNGFMWFFVPLILIYLSMPFFAIFILNSNRYILKLYLIIGLMMGCLPPISSSFTGDTSIHDIYLMGSRFLYFIVAGYYIGHFEISRKTRKRLYIFSVASAIIIFIGTMYLTLYIPNHYDYFLAYTNIPCTITAMGVFCFFKHHDWEKTLAALRLNKAAIAHYSGLSLGIYLIQGVWFTIIGHFHIYDYNMLMKFIVMYIVCVISVWIIKYIPLVKKIV